MSKMNVLTSKYWFGDTVYLIHDPDQSPRMVVGIEFSGSEQNISYHLSSGSICTPHYEYELSADVNPQMAMGIYNDNEN